MNDYQSQYSSESETAVVQLLCGHLWVRFETSGDSQDDLLPETPQEVQFEQLRFHPGTDRVEITKGSGHARQKIETAWRIVKSQNMFLIELSQEIEADFGMMTLQRDNLDQIMLQGPFHNFHMVPLDMRNVFASSKMVSVESFKWL